MPAASRRKPLPSFLRTRQQAPPPLGEGGSGGGVWRVARRRHLEAHTAVPRAAAAATRRMLVLTRILESNRHGITAATHAACRQASCAPPACVSALDATLPSPPQWIASCLASPSAGQPASWQRAAIMAGQSSRHAPALGLEKTQATPHLQGLALGHRSSQRTQPHAHHGRGRHPVIPSLATVSARMRPRLRPSIFRDGGRSTSAPRLLPARHDPRAAPARAQPPNPSLQCSPQRRLLLPPFASPTGTNPQVLAATTASRVEPSADVPASPNTPSKSAPTMPPPPRWESIAYRLCNSSSVSNQARPASLSKHHHARHHSPIDRDRLSRRARRAARHWSPPAHAPPLTCHSSRAGHRSHHACIHAYSTAHSCTPATTTTTRLQRRTPGERLHHQRRAHGSGRRVRPPSACWLDGATRPFGRGSARAACSACLLICAM